MYNTLAISTTEDIHHHVTQTNLNSVNLWGHLKAKRLHPLASGRRPVCPERDGLLAWQLLTMSQKVRN